MKLGSHFSLYQRFALNKTMLKIQYFFGLNVYYCYKKEGKKNVFCLKQENKKQIDIMSPQYLKRCPFLLNS